MDKNERPIGTLTVREYRRLLFEHVVAALVFVGLVGGLILGTMFWVLLGRA